MDPSAVATALVSNVASNIISQYIIENLPRIKTKKYGEIKISASIMINFYTSPYLSEALTLASDLFPNRERQREISIGGNTFSVQVSLFPIPILEIDDYEEDNDFTTEYEEESQPAIRRATIFLYPTKIKDNVLEAIRELYLKVSDRMSGSAKTKLFIEIFIEDHKKASELFNNLIQKLNLIEKPNLESLTNNDKTIYHITVGFGLADIDGVNNLSNILFEGSRFKLLWHQR